MQMPLNLEIIRQDLGSSLKLLCFWIFTLEIFIWIIVCELQAFG